MKIWVLDHGYVNFVEAWGHGTEDDTPEDLDMEIGIIEAARQSTQGTFRGWDIDVKLLKTLWTGKLGEDPPHWPESPRHATPFEFAGMVLEIQAPLFVFREWHRHRTQSYNEMSARYAPLPDLYYVPSVERVMMRSKSNKQAQAASNSPELTEDRVREWIGFLEEFEGYYHQAEAAYQSALRVGIPKELARITMPVGHYSRMRACANLRNWLAFLSLRLDENAQWEIRQYATAVDTIVEKYFPQTWKLFHGNNPYA